MKRVLVMTAVEAEREAVLRGLNGDTRFAVALAGVGPAQAAARTAAALAGRSLAAGGSGSSDLDRGEAADGSLPGFDLVICAGIGGGFEGIAPVGSLAAATEIVAADLGAESPEGFLTVDELGFGTARFKTDRERTERLLSAWRSAGLPACGGPILTVSTVTGTASTAAARSRLVPGAAAEGMEGCGVAAAAQVWGLPVLEIRAISNLVGPRDRSVWRIKEALEILEKACRPLPEVLFAK